MDKKFETHSGKVICLMTYKKYMAEPLVESRAKSKIHALKS